MATVARRAIEKAYQRGQQTKRRPESSLSLCSTIDSADQQRRPAAGHSSSHFRRFSRGSFGGRLASRRVSWRPPFLFEFKVAVCRVSLSVPPLGGSSPCLVASASAGDHVAVGLAAAHTV
jgi:hypothetical protein